MDPVGLELLYCHASASSSQGNGPDPPTGLERPVPSLTAFAARAQRAELPPPNCRSLSGAAAATVRRACQLGPIRATKRALCATAPGRTEPRFGSIFAGTNRVERQNIWLGPGPQRATRPDFQRPFRPSCYVRERRAASCENSSPPWSEPVGVIDATMVDRLHLGCSSPERS